VFDLRYHVASLAAVFLALILGILVGVGISRSGFVSESERLNLEAQIARLRSELKDARRDVQRHESAEAFVDETYPAVMAGRLDGRGIAVVFVGSVDGELRNDVEDTLTRAGGRRLRLRAVKVPLDMPELEAALPADTGAVQVRGREHLDDLGRLLGEEVVIGGSTPLWDSLAQLLVEEQTGGMQQPADGVVVVRSAERQLGDTARFLAGLYNGLASVGVPAVAVETSDGDHSALKVFDDAGFSTVNNVDTLVGRLALAVVLGGEAHGNYGVNASDGFVPRVPVAPPPRPRQ
jgi:hypothetical protein